MHKAHISGCVPHWAAKLELYFVYYTLNYFNCSKQVSYLLNSHSYTYKPPQFPSTSHFILKNLYKNFFKA